MSRIVLCVVFFGLLSAQGQSLHAKGVAIAVDETMADITTEPQQHTSNVIFLNRCVGGCTITPGYDDSRINRSSVVASTLGGTAYISEFARSESDWNQLVACVTDVYSPFDIVITDVDPGNSPHFEAIVAGRDSEINIQAGGVAPTSCGIINNAMSFSFANQGNLASLCWTVAQETAHAFGLDHEYLCEDPLTYLSSCGVHKTFQNEDAPCGEFSARQCRCGENTQNSFKHLMDHFGPHDGQPSLGPTIEIDSPKDGAMVNANFAIEVTAPENTNSVEFLIQGTVVSQLNSPPWIISAPNGLTGSVRVEARGTGASGVQGELVGVDVTISEDDLTDFGGRCEGNKDCTSGQCALDSEGLGSCTQGCDLEADDSCPTGSRCVDADGQGVCWMEDVDNNLLGSCGCSTKGRSPLGSVLTSLFLLLGLAYWQRRP